MGIKNLFVNFKVILFLVVLNITFCHSAYSAGIATPAIPFDVNLEGSKYYNLHLATQYEKDKKIDEAINEYKNVIEVEPANLIANYNLGIHYYNKWLNSYRKGISDTESEKHLNEALNYLLFVQQLNPNITMTYFKLGRIFTIKGELDSAILFYDKGIELSPTNYMFYFNLASLYETKNNTDLAIYNYKKCIELNKTLPHPYNNLALLYESLGSNDEAVKYYKMALDADGEYVYSLVNLGSLLVKNKNYPEAYKCFIKAMKINPDNPWIYMHLGDYYESQKMYDLAYGSYMKFVKMNPSYAKGYYLLCNILIKLNKEPEALVAGTIYLKLEPKGEYSLQIEEMISKIKKYSYHTSKSTS